MKHYKDYLNLYLFLIIVCSMIIPLTFINAGLGFNLNSNYVVFITHDSIIKYDPETQEEATIIDYGSIDEAEKYISFAQFPSDDNGYFFCRIKQFIYVFSKNFELLGNLTDDDITKAFVELVPFKSNDGQLKLISIFGNEDSNLELKLYKLNYPNSSGNILEIITVNIQKKLRDYEFEEQVMNKRVSCELTYSSEYKQEQLTCFLVNTQCMILAINFNPDSLSPLSFSKNSKNTNGINNIVSAVSPDKKKCISCCKDFGQNFECLIYDVESNELSDPVIFMTDCSQLSYGVNIQYISETKEYIGYCYSDIYKKNIIKFDENFEVKESENNSKYYISISANFEICYNVYSISVLYIKSSQDYYIAKTCYLDNVLTLNLLQISEENIEKKVISQDAYLYKSESTSISNTKSTIPLTSKSTLISNIQNKSAIPTLKSAFISNIQMKSSTPTTKSTLVSNIQIQSTFPILKTTLLSNIYMSITPTSKSTLVSSIKSNIPIFSTKTQSLSLSSSILSSSLISTKKSNNMSTNISNSIISKSSSFKINTIQNLESIITKTITSISGKSTSLLAQNTLSSNIKDYILFSSLSPKLSSTSISKLSLSDSLT